MSKDTHAKNVAHKAEQEVKKPGEAKVGGTSPTETVVKEGASLNPDSAPKSPEQNKSEGEAQLEAAKDHRDPAAAQQAEVKHGSGDGLNQPKEWSAERRTEKTADVEKKYGLKHGELGSKQVESEVCTEHNLREQACEERGMEPPAVDAKQELGRIGFVELMKLTRWLTDEVGSDIGPLMSNYERFKEAASIRERWEALKAAGDIIIEDVETFPADIFTEGSGPFSADNVYEACPPENSEEFAGLAEFADKAGVDTGEIIAFAREMLPLILELIFKYLRR